jgi:hypothetical protein
VKTSRDAAHPSEVTWPEQQLVLNQIKRGACEPWTLPVDRNLTASYVVVRRRRRPRP